ncbi:hypothetical protein TraAM80_08037 [Trypanosoma rangeli]|uniref:Uncharacterized protein n=1 Tax=Trypanosoma rangeli TaxID=5698 RepID=A0A422N339_TRYRA|nr:uncharacterized protein TraAM80_08037 [Trypanosoma rangeli]RNE99897.1 hypothetical protein TraAM80_08037 [Trypanosoma rangeli]|eukprot:RNE99897.1 hypothetical protein TraAM80_08037 [Trypanosoma rangeli]
MKSAKELNLSKMNDVQHYDPASSSPHTTRGGDTSATHHHSNAKRHCKENNFVFFHTPAPHINDHKMLNFLFSGENYNNVDSYSPMACMVLDDPVLPGSSGDVGAYMVDNYASRRQNCCAMNEDERGSQEAPVRAPSPKPLNQHVLFVDKPQVRHHSFVGSSNEPLKGILRHTSSFTSRAKDGGCLSQRRICPTTVEFDIGGKEVQRHLFKRTQTYGSTSEESWSASSDESRAKEVTKSCDKSRVRTLVVMESSPEEDKDVEGKEEASAYRGPLVRVLQGEHAIKVVGVPDMLITPDEIVTHPNNSNSTESVELNKVKDLFISGYSTSVICLEGSGLTRKVPVFGSPSWCILKEFLRRVIDEAMEEARRSVNHITLAGAFAAIRKDEVACLLEKRPKFKCLSVSLSPLFGMQFLGLEYRNIRDSNAFDSIVHDVEDNCSSFQCTEISYIVFSLLLNKRVMGVTDDDGDIIVGSLQIIFLGEAVGNLLVALHSSSEEPQAVLNESIYGACHTLSVYVSHLHDTRAAEAFRLQKSLMNVEHSLPRYGGARTLLKTLDEAIGKADARLMKISNLAEKKSTEIYIENRMLLKKSLDVLLEKVRPQK